MPHRTSLSFVSRANLQYQISNQPRPVLRVSLGQAFRLETEDCYTGLLKNERDPYPPAMRGHGNPSTGPVYIKGTRPGHLLRIEVLRIRLLKQAVMHQRPGWGVLFAYQGRTGTALYPLRQNRLLWKRNYRLALRPMIGVLGLAPAGRGQPTTFPGEHGGNLDCKVITAGAVVYLPVQVAGGYLFAGDLHAVMGDGEVCGCGAEAAGSVVLRTRLARIKLPSPCVETRRYIYFLASAATLDECESLVLKKAHYFLHRLAGFNPNAAARFMSLAGDLQVCQVVNPLKTMRFRLPHPRVYWPAGNRWT